MLSRVIVTVAVQSNARRGSQWTLADEI